ncbi:MAG TPA: hypothetical protein VE995_02520 [Gaiellaceae bacterium]|nr:hypothetical protein [Gaiellaceae bacterium]
MAHLVLLNLIFFLLPTCGAAAFAFLVWRFLRSSTPPEPGPPEGGSKTRLPVAGPDDLARSA